MDRPPSGDRPKKKSGRLEAKPDLFPTTEPVSDSTPTAHFSGTNNPRHLRVLHSLMTRPRRREEIDHIAGASNGPDLIAELRRRGQGRQLPPGTGIDRDGNPVRFGVYALDDADRCAINAWLRLRDGKGPA